MAFGRRRRQEADEAAILDGEHDHDDDGHDDDGHDHDGRGHGRPHLPHLHLPHRHRPGDDHPADGPYDVAEAPRDELQRLDAGSLRVPAVEGTQIQFQLDEATGNAVSVVVADGQSAMELAVFAAPRTAGLWDDVRAEIVEQLQAAGGSPRVAEGRHGPELELVLPTPVPGQMVPGRMIGIDGPRWFLRAVMTGPGALDPAQAPLLDETLRRLVIVRGDEAMPVRDPLPMHLPKELLEHMQAVAPPDGTGTAADAGRPQMPTPGVRIAELR
jgi:hypothetical protein